ncbi:antibiotic biosynthesis monooxygenase family protein [Leucobacter sp. USHLN153]|uniref:antibiotic biosynthesis monooxygenase family protein n=1 Tax=Leucobacter sp. USHLN153 TaxID=3081268 RepID=UPI003015FEB0
MNGTSLTQKPQYSSTFIFETANLTEEFHRIDSEIATRAREIPGFLGEEAWHNEATGLHAEVYYWTDMDALKQLITMDTHQLAKSRYDEWLGEYRVVISEVQAVYGNPAIGLEHQPKGNQGSGS